MSPSLRTVTGLVMPGDLGPTLAAEHLHADLSPGVAPGKLWDAPLTIDRLGDVHLGAANRENLTLTDTALVIEELRAFPGRTVVDLTTPDRGRDLDALRRIADGTGLHIIAASGRRSPGGSAADLTREFIDELNTSTGVLGHLGALDASDPSVRDLVTALAAAHHETGAGIVIEHTPSGPGLFGLLIEHGVASTRIAVTGIGAASVEAEGLASITMGGAFLVLGRVDQDVSASRGRVLTGDATRDF